MDSASGVKEDPDNAFYRRMKQMILEKYRGKHIAISGGKIVAVADSFEQLVKELKEKGLKKIIALEVGVDVAREREWPGWA